MTEFADRPVLFYDGFCNLCSGVVQFVLKRDTQHRIAFAPLQAPESIAFLARHGIDATKLDTIVTVVDGRASVKSTGVIRIVETLPGAWRMAKVLLVLPRAFRDWVYDFVGRNRYRWFGQRDTCYLPPDGGRSAGNVRNDR